MISTSEILLRVEMLKFLALRSSCKKFCGSPKSGLSADLSFRENLKNCGMWDGSSMRE